MEVDTSFPAGRETLLVVGALECHSYAPQVVGWESCLLGIPPDICPSCAAPSSRSPRISYPRLHMFASIRSAALDLRSAV